MTEFCILPCSCGKTPTINKNMDKTDEHRYTLQHCDTIANGNTETQCIVNWNKLHKQEEEINESND